jgi:RHS repeat-associated protein
LGALLSTPASATTYTYDTRNRLKSETISGVHSRSYDYDSYDRPVKVTETITGKAFVTYTAYDAYGRVQKETYPTGYFTTSAYDDYGYLTTVTDSKGVTIWEATEADAFGRLTKYRQGGRTTSIAYHQKSGLPTSIVAGNAINMSYDYDGEGHLKSRYDIITGQQETFSYDSMNRLSGWTHFRPGAGTQTYSMSYDAATGGIKTKPHVDYTMSYGGSEMPPHALASVAGTPQALAGHLPQTISYNDFSKVSSIVQETKTHSITYGTGRQRVKSSFATSGSTTLTKYYLGNYEEEHLPGGKIRKLHYISGGSGLAAIYVQNNGADSLYYTYCDYQGNLLAVTDAAGNVKERYAYDPWGLRKNPANWSQPDSRKSFLFSRGYTLHEHLDDYGLINMNGRVYDPLMAQFLSPDPYIQAPDSWMNYNRYAYCLNNPLMYSDPSGEFFWAALPLIAKIGIGIGAGVGAYTGYKIGEANGASGLGMAGYMLGGAVIGGFSGYLGGTIAAGGGFMANTSAIMMSSYTNSMGMTALSGGQMAPSISFGVASFNFGTGEFGYLGKKGNSFMENLGYGLGALANVSDVLAGFKPGEVQLNTEKSDAIGHSALTKVGETDPYNSLVSVGPDPGGKWIFNPFKFKNGTNHWKNYVDAGDDVWKIGVKGVNVQRITSYGANLNRGVNYNLYFSSCVNHTARALTLAGAPSIGLHPFILHSQMVLRSVGFRPMLYSYHFYQY